jgi:hypothetical protein
MAFHDETDNRCYRCAICSATVGSQSRRITAFRSRQDLAHYVDASLGATANCGAVNPLDLSFVSSFPHAFRMHQLEGESPCQFTCRTGCLLPISRMAAAHTDFPCSHDTIAVLICFPRIYKSMIIT